MQPRKPTLAPSDIDAFINDAPLKHATNEASAPAPAEALAEVPTTPGRRRPHAAALEPKEDPIVALNVKVNLSLRNWLNIEAIKKGQNLSTVVSGILERHKALRS